MSEQAEIAVDGVLVDAITKVTRRWDRNPDRWDATFDELLDLQSAMEYQERPLGEICWDARAVLVREGFPVLANQMASACSGISQATPSGYVTEPVVDEPWSPEPAIDVAPLDVAREPAGSAFLAGLQPVKTWAATVGSKAEATVHQVSLQLAEDDGTPMLGLGGLFFGLAALVRTIKRR